MKRNEYNLGRMVGSMTDRWKHFPPSAEEHLEQIVQYLSENLKNIPQGRSITYIAHDMMIDPHDVVKKVMEIVSDVEATTIKKEKLYWSVELRRKEIR